MWRTKDPMLAAWLCTQGLIVVDTHIDAPGQAAWEFNKHPTPEQLDTWLAGDATCNIKTGITIHRRLMADARRQMAGGQDGGQS